jgi:hypothetical protein
MQGAPTNRVLLYSVREVALLQGTAKKDAHEQSKIMQCAIGFTGLGSFA